MKTITIEKNLYDFEEVKEKALEKNRYILVDDYSYWYDETITFCEDELKDIGFIKPEIYFSGFWSQGDGACFDADIDVEKLLDYLLEIKKFSTEEITKLKNLQDDFKTQIITINNHYYHERTRKFEVYCVDAENPDDLNLIDKLEKAVEEIRLEKCKEIYNKLEDEYDNLTSDSVLADWLNDAYWFNEDGSIYESK